jgi:hypothetical protein
MDALNSKLTSGKLPEVGAPALHIGLGLMPTNYAFGDGPKEDPPASAKVTTEKFPYLSGYLIYEIQEICG